MLTYRDALNEALHTEMSRDPNVIILGEDVGRLGGIHGVTTGLQEEYGAERVIETGISESAIVGVAIGTALHGMRPVAEIMYVDFMPCAMDQIVNCLAKLQYIYGGTTPLPVVVRTQQGAVLGSGMHHSQSLEALFVHIPGLVVAMPSTPSDAKGMLIASIRSQNPVIFIEHKALYDSVGPVDEMDYTVPLGKGQIIRAGSDVTIVTWSSMVREAKGAAETLAASGVEAEIIDLRSLLPWDKQLVLSSVHKTGHLIVAHEACRTGGVGAEIVASVVEHHRGGSLPRCMRVAARDVPIPYCEELHKAVLPTASDIVAASHECLNSRNNGGGKGQHINQKTHQRI